MNRHEQDAETIKYNYVALKKIHLIANETNKALNIRCTELEKELKLLKENLIVVQESNNTKQKMVTDSYTRMNEMQNGFNQVINDLHIKNKNLEEQIKEIANGGNIN